MTITVFELCRPRPDGLSGALTEADFAADLAQVVCGSGGPDTYRRADLFFATT